MQFCSASVSMPISGMDAPQLPCVFRILTSSQLADGVAVSMSLAGLHIAAGPITTPPKVAGVLISRDATFGDSKSRSPPGMTALWHPAELHFWLNSVVRQVGVVLEL